MTEEDLFYFTGEEMRASRPIWVRYGINRYELNLLCSIQAHMNLYGNRTTTFRKVMEWIGGSKNFNYRCKGYFQGILRNGCVHQLNYIGQPVGNGNTICLSEFGAKILNEFYREAARLESVRPDKYLSPEQLAVNIRDIQKVLPKYRLFLSGRDC